MAWLQEFIHNKNTDVSSQQLPSANCVLFSLCSESPSATPSPDESSSFKSCCPVVLEARPGSFSASLTSRAYFHMTPPHTWTMAIFLFSEVVSWRVGSQPTLVTSSIQHYPGLVEGRRNFLVPAAKAPPFQKEFYQLAQDSHPCTSCSRSQPYSSRRPC